MNTTNDVSIMTDDHFQAMYARLNEDDQEDIKALMRSKVERQEATTLRRLRASTPILMQNVPEQFGFQQLQEMGLIEIACVGSLNYRVGNFSGTAREILRHNTTTGKCLTPYSCDSSFQEAFLNGEGDREIVMISGAEKVASLVVTGALNASQIPVPVVGHWQTSVGIFYLVHAVLHESVALVDKTGKKNIIITSNVSGQRFCVTAFVVGGLWHFGCISQPKFGASMPLAKGDRFIIAL